MAYVAPLPRRARFNWNSGTVLSRENVRRLQRFNFERSATPRGYRQWQKMTALAGSTLAATPATSSVDKAIESFILISMSEAQAFPERAALQAAPKADESAAAG